MEELSIRIIKVKNGDKKPEWFLIDSDFQHVFGCYQDKKSAINAQNECSLPENQWMLEFRLELDTSKLIQYIKEHGTHA